MKLRYWDKDTKKMYGDNHFVYWNSNFYFREDSNKIDGILSGKRKGIVGYSILEDNIMQSTGLLDKNGIEIFEGDVVYMEEYCNPSEYEYLIARKKDGECIMSNCQLQLNLLKNVHYIEIIGNVFMEEFEYLNERYNQGM